MEKIINIKNHEMYKCPNCKFYSHDYIERIHITKWRFRCKNCNCEYTYETDGLEPQKSEEVKT